jgi:hypothetical protein
MGRRERRATQARHKASVARFRREAEGVLRTYLVAPSDPQLGSIPILKRATRSWLDNLKVASPELHCLELLDSGPAQCRRPPAIDGGYRDSESGVNLWNLSRVLECGSPAGRLGKSQRG